MWKKIREYKVSVLVSLLLMAVCVCMLFTSEYTYSKRLEADKAQHALCTLSGIVEDYKSNGITRQLYVKINGQWLYIPSRTVDSMPIQYEYTSIAYWETSKTLEAVHCNVYLPTSIRETQENNLELNYLSMIPEDAGLTPEERATFDPRTQCVLENGDDAELVAYEYYRQYEISQGRTTEQYYREGRYVYSFYCEPLHAYWCTILPDDYEERLEEPFTYAQMILDAGTGEPLYFWLEENQ